MSDKNTHPCPKRLNPWARTASGLLLSLCLVLMACTTQSVRHLKQEPWILEKPQHLSTTYLRFDYVCSQSPKGLKVQGTARPLQDGPIPEWAIWARDLWMGAYISDKSGQVLAKNVQILPSQRVDGNHPIFFTFVLHPQSMGEPGPVSISFGYRLVLAAGPKDLIQSDRNGSKQALVFFATESALTRF